MLNKFKEKLIDVSANGFEIPISKPFADNKIGFDLQFMQGINSLFQNSTTSNQGIPVRFKDQYLSLLQVPENKE